MVLIDYEKCTGCGYCGLICPQLTLSLHEGMCHQLHPARCVQCCSCELHCDNEAVMVVVDTYPGEKNLTNRLFNTQHSNMIFPC